MTSFLRFLVLALTPLLAVSVSFGPAVLYGLAATLVLTAVAILVFYTRDTLREGALTWSVLGLAAVLVTLIDLVTSLWLPGVRQAWGLYLNLLAFSPVIALLPLEKPAAASVGVETTEALKTGGLLTLLFAGTALVREVLGAGSLTILPGATLNLPLLNDYPLSILDTGAGAFFLAAAGMVLYRSFRPRSAPLVVEVAESPAPERTPPPAPEPTEAWGEDVAAAVAAVGTLGTGKRRLLVIGSGNGEWAYYLSMLCLDQNKATPLDFRVRGVDHFATRIEAAVKGVYREHQIEFIPAALRQEWMTKGQGEDRLWRVNNEPRLHVQFEVADFQKGPLFFPQPCHLILLNQSIEYVSDEKKVQLLKTVCDNLLPGGALVVLEGFRREFLPEGMKRTGTAVFRKS